MAGSNEFLRVDFFLCSLFALLALVVAGFLVFFAVVFHMRRHQFGFNNRKGFLTLYSVGFGILYIICRIYAVFLSYYHISRDMSNLHKHLSNKTQSIHIIVHMLLFDLLNSVSLFGIGTCMALRIWLLFFDVNLAVHCGDEKWMELITDYQVNMEEFRTLSLTQRATTLMTRLTTSVTNRSMSFRMTIRRATSGTPRTMSRSTASPKTNLSSKSNRSVGFTPSKTAVDSMNSPVAALQDRVHHPLSGGETPVSETDGSLMRKSTTARFRILGFSDGTIRNLEQVNQSAFSKRRSKSPMNSPIGSIGGVSGDTGLPPSGASHLSVFENSLMPSIRESDDPDAESMIEDSPIEEATLHTAISQSSSESSSFGFRDKRPSETTIMKSIDAMGPPAKGPVQLADQSSGDSLRDRPHGQLGTRKSQKMLSVVSEMDDQEERYNASGSASYAYSIRDRTVDGGAGSSDSEDPSVNLHRLITVPDMLTPFNPRSDSEGSSSDGGRMRRLIMLMQVDEDEGVTPMGAVGKRTVKFADDTRDFHTHAKSEKIRHAQSLPIEEDDVDNDADDDTDDDSVIRVGGGLTSAEVTDFEEEEDEDEQENDDDIADDTGQNESEQQEKESPQKDDEHRETKQDGDEEEIDGAEKGIGPLKAPPARISSKLSPLVKKERERDSFMETPVPAPAPINLPDSTTNLINKDQDQQPLNQTGMIMVDSHSSLKSKSTARNSFNKRDIQLFEQAAHKSIASATQEDGNQPDPKDGIVIDGKLHSPQASNDIGLLNRHKWYFKHKQTYGNLFWLWQSVILPLLVGFMSVIVMMDVYLVSLFFSSSDTRNDRMIVRYSAVSRIIVLSGIYVCFMLSGLVYAIQIYRKFPTFVDYLLIFNELTMITFISFIMIIGYLSIWLTALSSVLSGHGSGFGIYIEVSRSVLILFGVSSLSIVQTQWVLFQFQHFRNEMFSDKRNHNNGNNIPGQSAGHYRGGSYPRLDPFSSDGTRDTIYALPSLNQTGSDRTGSTWTSPQNTYHTLRSNFWSTSPVYGGKNISMENQFGLCYYLLCCIDLTADTVQRSGRTMSRSTASARNVISRMRSSLSNQQMDLSPNNTPTQNISMFSPKSAALPSVAASETGTSRMSIDECTPAISMFSPASSVALGSTLHSGASHDRSNQTNNGREDTVSDTQISRFSIGRLTSRKASISQSSKKKGPSINVMLRRTFAHESAFRLFMAHLFHEFSYESLLAIIEFGQFSKWMLMDEGLMDDRGRFTVDIRQPVEMTTTSKIVDLTATKLTLVRFPYFVQKMKSSIVYHSELNGEQKFLVLFDKYISNSAELSVNIDYKTRKDLSDVASKLRKKNSEFLSTKSMNSPFIGGASSNAVGSAVNSGIMGMTIPTMMEGGDDEDMPEVDHTVFDVCIQQLIRLLRDSFSRFQRTSQFAKLVHDNPDIFEVGH